MTSVWDWGCVYVCVLKISPLLHTKIRICKIMQKLTQFAGSSQIHRGNGRNTDRRSSFKGRRLQATTPLLCPQPAAGPHLPDPAVDAISGGTVRSQGWGRRPGTRGFRAELWVKPRCYTLERGIQPRWLQKIPSCERWDHMETKLFVRRP